MILETTKGSHAGNLAACLAWQDKHQGGYPALRVMYGNGQEIYVDIDDAADPEDVLAAINAEGLGAWLGDENAPELRAIWAAREARGAR